MTTSMKDIGAALRKRRGDATGQEFAPEVGVKVSTYYRYETGERNLSIPNLRSVVAWAIARGDRELIELLVAYAFGVGLDILLEIL